MRRRCRDEAAFTIPEVIVVTIIIAILAAIAIVTFIDQRDKADRTHAVSTLRNVQLHAETLRADSPDGNYVGDLAAYESMGRYTFVGANDVSSAPEVVSVSVAADGTVSAFAARGGATCLYLRLETATGVNARHEAALGGGTTCRASEFETGP